MATKQVMEKIEKIKTKIAEKVDLKDIVKDNFSRNVKKMNEWIEKNAEEFTAEELQYLGYVNNGITECLQENKVIKQDVSLQTNGAGTEEVNKHTERLQTIAGDEKFEIALNIPKERLQKLFTLENIEILENLIEAQKMVHIEGETVIPDFYKKIPNDKNVSMRMNGEIFDRFKLYATETKTTIAHLMNYLLDMFLKEVKR
ncbi:MULTISPECIES: hypothetical protein [Fusobacterium]|jgi:hypothetical protein|uniref:Uncharacterized protein n=1 Tax=Fusobacterium animalis TaxID=76859 RepID=A0A2B7YQY3_9FUSO|nr:hypothetical protein [Fusobacterium animalis]PGH23298.1 hypothetical protein RN90_12955 [Fusobacterium animalis]